MTGLTQPGVSSARWARRRHPRRPARAGTRRARRCAEQADRERGVARLVDGLVLEHRRRRRRARPRRPTGAGPVTTANPSPIAEAAQRTRMPRRRRRREQPLPVGQLAGALRGADVAGDVVDRRRRRRRPGGRPARAPRARRSRPGDDEPSAAAASSRRRLAVEQAQLVVEEHGRAARGRDRSASASERLGHLDALGREHLHQRLRAAGGRVVGAEATPGARTSPP